MKRYRLQHARQSINMTQADVANYLGVVTNMYQAIELGTRGTTQKNWLKLFDLFGQQIPLNELMALTPFPLPTVTDNILTGIA